MPPFLFKQTAVKCYRESSFLHCNSVKTVSDWGLAPNPTRKAHSPPQASYLIREAISSLSTVLMNTKQEYKRDSEGNGKSGTGETDPLFLQLV
jgi:hypothetical protein